jgi:precorrin-6B methylase 2
MSDYALTLSDAEIRRYQHMAASAHRAEADLWAAAGIVDGAVVADVGCGPGAIATLMARLVGDRGHVWALDQNEGALGAADALSTSLGIGNLSIRPGDATATGLDPASVDVVVMRHVLAHNGGREQAIVDHLASLVKPGGNVYLVDTDVTAVRIPAAPHGLADLTDCYVRFQTARGNDLCVGLRLADLLAAAGLEVVEYRGRFDIIPAQPGFRPPAWAARDLMVEAGIATAADVERWGAAFERLDQGDPPGVTTFVPVFSAIGRRPA